MSEEEQSLSMTSENTAPVSERGEWVLVPREPTEAMIAAGWQVVNEIAACIALYRAMLSASPAPHRMRLPPSAPATTA